MKYRDLPIQSLGFFPTPITKLDRLSAHLGGPRILMKRDDHTGLAFGGNKTRKLEFLVAEALKQGSDLLITGGAEQSNHCRQTAAAAATCGLLCHLVLGGEAPSTSNGNLLLNKLLGARLHWTGEFRKGEKIPEIAQDLRRAGHKPYIVPYGGSNSTGAAGYARAVEEIGPQLTEMGETVSHVVFASSSGGTQAGLAVGKAICGQTFDLVGIRIDKGEAGELPYDQHLAQLAGETARRLGMDRDFSASEFIIREDFLGEGYGIVGDGERRA
ncbi:MAG: pyridoxal-phosphate dependent enzyme, partial [Gammaproteobacteria bacterium]